MSDLKTLAIQENAALAAIAQALTALQANDTANTQTLASIQATLTALQAAHATTSTAVAGVPPVLAGIANAVDATILTPSATPSP
jgi:hypothetical protein